MLNETERQVDQLRRCLNPCFNGICSMSYKDGKLERKVKGLNPCFNGICSMSG